MADTDNYDITSRYFDIVQEEIKKLIAQDKEIKQDQVEQFNSEIFNQPEEMQSEIREFINKVTTNNLDIKKVAKSIYDRFKVQVKNNVFNNTDAQDVPNPMMGERKFIKTFEQWTSDVAGDYDVNYGDKPQLSEVVTDTIEYIENNFDNIKQEINYTSENRIYFNSGKYTSILLEIDNGVPMLSFGYDDYYFNHEIYSYSEDITDDEYYYLKKYFLEIYKKIRNKVHDNQKEDYIKNMKRVEDRITRRDAKKYNL